MNPAHLHLVLNHIPLVGIAFVILLLIIALLRTSNELINVSLIFVILIALWAIPAYLTGEPAEEMVEGLPGISEQLIEAHEEKAEITFILVEVVGAFALLTLIIRRFHRELGNILSVFTLLGLIVAGGLIVWTANLGGKINHPEIRSNTSILTVPSYKSGDENDHD
jgi:formate hydrogenlyase subunit 3/multisubunit Na+/H+ antiporter MnhD subunit